MEKHYEGRANVFGKHLAAAAVSVVLTMSILLGIGFLADHYSTGSMIQSTAKLAA
jgi:hypothetical protein